MKTSPTPFSERDIYVGSRPGLHAGEAFSRSFLPGPHYVGQQPHGGADWGDVQRKRCTAEIHMYLVVVSTRAGYYSSRCPPPCFRFW